MCVGNFPTSWENSGFSSRTVLHAVTVIGITSHGLLQGTTQKFVKQDLRITIQSRQLVCIPVKIRTLNLQIQVPSFMAWATLPLSSSINEAWISEWHLKCIPCMWSILSRIVAVQPQECTTNHLLKPFHCIGSNQWFGGMYVSVFSGGLLDELGCDCSIHTALLIFALSMAGLYHRWTVSCLFLLEFSLPDFTEVSQSMNTTYFMLQKFFRNKNISKKLN